MSMEVSLVFRLIVVVLGAAMALVEGGMVE